MSSDPLALCASARLAQADLAEIDRQLSVDGPADSHFVVLVKHALVSVANVADLDRSARAYYQKYPDVPVQFKRWAKQFEFAKYVRNVFAGHVDDRLIAKAIEWRPELRSLLLLNKPEASLFINVCLLETAINTFVDAAEKHLLFDSETDLGYPPNWTRFLIFLTDIVRGGLDYLNALILALQNEAPPPPSHEEHMMLSMAAGKTAFKRLTRGR